MISSAQKRKKSSLDIIKADFFNENEHILPINNPKQLLNIRWKYNKQNTLNLDILSPIVQSSSSSFSSQLPYHSILKEETSNSMQITYEELAYLLQKNTISKVSFSIIIRKTQQKVVQIPQNYQQILEILQKALKSQKKDQIHLKFNISSFLQEELQEQNIFTEFLSQIRRFSQQIFQKCSKITLNFCQNDNFKNHNSLLSQQLLFILDSLSKQLQETQKQQEQKILFSKLSVQFTPSIFILSEKSDKKHEQNLQNDIDMSLFTKKFLFIAKNVETIKIENYQEQNGVLNQVWSSFFMCSRYHYPKLRKLKIRLFIDKVYEFLHPNFLVENQQYYQNLEEENLFIFKTLAQFVQKRPFLQLYFKISLNFVSDEYLSIMVNDLLLQSSNFKEISLFIATNSQSMESYNPYIEKLQESLKKFKILKIFQFSLLQDSENQNQNEEKISKSISSLLQTVSKFPLKTLSITCDCNNNNLDFRTNFSLSNPQNLLDFQLNLSQSIPNSTIKQKISPLKLPNLVRVNFSDFVLTQLCCHEYLRNQETENSESQYKNLIHFFKEFLHNSKYITYLSITDNEQNKHQYNGYINSLATKNDSFQQQNTFPSYDSTIALCISSQITQYLNTKLKILYILEYLKLRTKLKRIEIYKELIFDFLLPKPTNQQQNQ